VAPRIESVRSWLSLRPTASDALVAVLLTVPGLWQVFDVTPRDGYRQGDVRNALIVVGVMAAVAMRRRAPMAVLVIVSAGNVLLAGLHYASTVAEIMAFLIAIYNVAAHRALSVSVGGGILAVLAFTVIILELPDRAKADFSFVNFIVNLALIGGIWWVGRNMRLRRAYEAELKHRAARLERARELDARAARVEERSRIARELHDVVAHHVSVMTVQAGAARRIIDKSPETAREAMATIEETGRSALSEMRRIVGVLRTDRDSERDPAAALAPQPGIHEVGELIDHVRETGLSVQLWVEGEARQLPPGVNLAAYRLIQEALTNTLKHAGPQARAWVRIHYAPHELTVQIEDDGRGVAAALVEAGSAENEPGGGGAAGHGMVGMHERVALYGGQLRIGPRVGGGFEVRARFPVE
jgi:signal transduction histidine kinase